MSNWFQRRWEARDQQVNQVSRAVEWYPDRHQFAVERRGPVWSQNWRNLHAGERAEIRIGIAEEDSGTTTIGVDWPSGTDIDVDEMKAWVQREGRRLKHLYLGRACKSS